MPTKAEKKQLDGAVASFHSHYSSSINWGAERWNDSLYPALIQPTRYAALVNQFAFTEDVDTIFAQLDLFSGTITDLELPQQEQALNGTLGSIRLLAHDDSRLIANDSENTSMSANSNFLFPQPTLVPSSRDRNEKVLSHWNLDAASVLAALMLNVEPRDKVLDLCAAPGGKSVVLAQRLFPQMQAQGDVKKPISGCLHSNEMDPARNKRLTNNLHSYLPQELFETRAVRILRLDAANTRAINDLPLGAGGYDKVLLDAPCSSERHILHAHTKATSSGRIATEMARWKSGGSKSLSKLQTSLLLTALKAVKVGGRVVYSTCSIDSGENDGVLEKTIASLDKDHKKTGLNWTIRVETRKESPALSDQQGLDKWSERTKYGWISLPDHPNSGCWGPLFFAVLTKVPRGSKSQ